MELALLLPVLVLMLWGIFEFGLGYSAKIQLSGAVRDGARTGALSTDPTSVLASVTTSVRNAAPGITPSSITVTMPTTCPASPGPSDKATVTATYPFPYSIPFFGKGTWTITATGVMRCGG